MCGLGIIICFSCQTINKCSKRCYALGGHEIRDCYSNFANFSSSAEQTCMNFDAQVETRCDAMLKAGSCDQL